MALKIIKNSDYEEVQRILKEIKENDGYCPCSMLKDDTTKCMCEEFRNQFKEGSLGSCHCGLYQIVEE